MWPARRSSIRNWISEMGFMSGPWQKERVLSRLRLNGASLASSAARIRSDY
jgi:hypothetical protein